MSRTDATVLITGGGVRSEVRLEKGRTLHDFLADVAAEIEAQLPMYLDRSEELTALVEKLHGTAEVLRDLETATQPED